MKVSKNYTPINFREDLKEKLLLSGCDFKEITFNMNDTQMIHNQFLEDINNFLNTGELAGIYEREDFERMQISLEKHMQELGRPQTQELVYQTYTEVLRANFHIILCMSPVGDLLRLRCRNFPSLVNCCTLDWFKTWPKTALETVALRYIS